ncbi:cytochrome P450 [Xylariaceae sp. AK1471]|nr:cytochrome P450 [Xylariaceae sp. AK1471]
MLLYLVFVSVLVCLCYHLKQKLCSPLSHVPQAHWSSRFSSVWILWVRYSGQELSELIKAHKKYGPIVQVGPQDLSVSNYHDGIRKIYDGGFPKPAPFFAPFQYYGRQNAFTSLDRSEHGRRRKRTAALYSKSALLQSTHLRAVTDKTIYDRLIPFVGKAAGEGRKVDGLDLSYRFCSDFLSSFLFGYSNGSQYLCQTESEISTWRAHYENTMCHETFFVQETPRLYKALKFFSIDLLPRSYWESRRFLEQWMSYMARRADANNERIRSMGLRLAPEDEPVVYDAAMTAVERDSPHLSAQERREEVASEIFDHISNSPELAGLVLGYAIWYIAQNPRAQQAIRDELAAHGVDMKSLYQGSSLAEQVHETIAAKLDSLPYLRAVIDESLRMRPTSTPLPRVTPHTKTSCVAGVENIPPGTRINAFQWFVHRDPAKWERVDEWCPERWLHRDVDRKLPTEDVLWPFVSGPRTCLGNNLTYYVMQHMIAALVSRFTFTALSHAEEGHWPGSPDDRLPIEVVGLQSTTLGTDYGYAVPMWTSHGLHAKVRLFSSIELAAFLEGNILLAIIHVTYKDFTDLSHYLHDHKRVDMADTPETKLYVDAHEAQKFVEGVFTGNGVPVTNAITIARCLVVADLRGIDTHGMNRIPSS